MRWLQALRESDAERGSMLVEVTFLMVLVMLPLFYLVGTLGRLQAGAYAVSAAAREGARTFVAASDDGAGQAAAVLAASFVLDSHGFTASDGGITVACEASPCLTPGSTVRVESSLTVELPLIPDFMSGALPTSMTLTSSHVAPVDEFRES